MAEHVIFEQWREQTSNNNFPFAAPATLVNSEGKVIVEGSFVDAALYVIGGQAGLFLSKVVITHQTVTFFVGDSLDRERASGAIALVNTADDIYLSDRFNRPAGVLISTASRLNVFQAWGLGEHTFEPAESEFAATVCIPTPPLGVRGIMLESGEILTGEIWLVGDDGVIVRTEGATLPADCGQDEETMQTIRVDVVGDPLFRRRLCVPTDLFFTPRFIKSIHIIDTNEQDITLTPDAFGNFLLVTNNDLAADTILRIVTQADGVTIRAVGTPDPSQAGAEL